MKITPLYIFFVTLIISCLPKSDSMVMNLNGALGYDWNTSIAVIEKDFIDKQYSDIKIENDSIYAKADYNGLFSDYYFRFSNEKMYAGGILYLGTPDPDVSEDGYTLEDLYTIQKNILQLFLTQYGEPQEVNEEAKWDAGEIRYYRWDFNNNCTLEFSMRIEYFILTACWIQVRYTNKNIEVIEVEEKPSIYSDGDFTYKKNENGTITITKYAGSGDVIIPAEIAGSSVTEIGKDAFKGYYGNELTSITIPDNVRTIDYHAFSDNPLTSITIGANVIFRDRDDGAFKGSGIPNGFDDFYVSNKRKSGTYVFMNGQWVFSN